MTLSDRNIVFKAGITLSFLFLLICITASVRAVPVYPLMETEITRRSAGLFRFITGGFTEARLMAVHFCILSLALYSFFSTVFVYYFFEKTQSPEILYVYFFIASFSTETLRLILPLGYIYEIPLLFYLISSRVILFGRCFGLFSLFTASICAVGYETQRQRNFILIIIVTTLVIALGVPIDTQTWNSSLNMINGYIPMFMLIEAGAFLITVVSFFVAALLRGSREFALIGAGSVLAFLGRHIFLNADTWAALPAGLLFLVAGTWLICTRLHKIYLWL